MEVGALDLCLGLHAGRQYRAITVVASIGRQRANGEPTKSVDVLYGASPQGSQEVTLNINELLVEAVQLYSKSRPSTAVFRN